jgi:hypothetical protein
VLDLDIVLCCAEQDLLFTLIVWVYCIMTGIDFLVDKLLLIYFRILPLLEQNVFSLRLLTSRLFTHKIIRND